jgi:hypothetical protein
VQRLERADDGCCAQVVFGGLGENGREEAELFYVELAEMQAQGVGSFAAAVGELAM